MRQLPLEFGEVTRDHRHVEASENQLLWLAVEQETEGRLKTALGPFQTRPVRAIRKGDESIPKTPGPSYRKA